MDPSKTPDNNEHIDISEIAEINQEDQDQSVSEDEHTQEHTAAADQEDNRQRSGLVSSLKEFAAVLVTALAFLFIANNFLIHTYLIPSESMEDTLHGCPGCVDDRIIIDKVSMYFRSPHAGDVVVFKAPFSGWVEPGFTSVRSHNSLIAGLQTAASWFGFQPPDEFDLIKRVVATGGQTISCRIKDGGITVDGKLIHEPYLSASAKQYAQKYGPCWGSIASDYRKHTGGVDPAMDVKSPEAEQLRSENSCLAPHGIISNLHGEFGPITVPRDNVFVLGDNRNNSADSRFHIMDGNCGAVPVANIRGIARWIIYPFDRISGIGSINPQQS